MKTLSSLVLIAILSWSFALRADDGLKERDKEEAETAFRTGQSLFDEGNYLEAAEAFQRAYHFVQHPAVLANIGYCYRAAGDYPRAVESFRKYLRQPNPKTPKKNAEIKKYLGETASKVGDLEVDCSPVRCEVTVDTVSRGLAPATIVLLAGEHNVDVMGIDSDEARRYEVVIPAGGKLELDVDLSSSLSSPEESVTRTVTPPESSGKSVRLRAPFWIATSATVAGGAAVAVLGVLSNKARDEFRSGGYIDTDLKRQGENLTLGANIAVGITGVSAIVAITAAIIDIKSRKQGDDGIAGTSKTSHFSIEPICGASFLGIRGAF